MASVPSKTRSAAVQARSGRIARGILGILCLLPWMATAQPLAPEAVSPLPLPSFAQLEAAGARVGEIRIAAEDIFDTSDPQEDRRLFRWANALHRQTRPEVIRRALLFKTGEPVSERKIEETERLLRSNRYLYDVRLQPVALRDGVVDIEVVTRDTWSLDPGFSVGRAGGANSSGLRVTDYNLGGTGTTLGFGRSTGVDRTSNTLVLSNDRAFGSWVSVNLSHSANSDGQRDAVSVIRPFYALDSRWSAGVSAVSDDRIDSVYANGEVVSQYRRRQQQAEVFAGWSDGRLDGWVRRSSVGLQVQSDAFTALADRPAPPALPADDRRVMPFVRYALLEDRFERERNRNLIGRPEFFALGLNSSVQLGWVSRALGSTRDALAYSASVAQGFEPRGEDTLLASASVQGLLVNGRIEAQRLGAQAQYYRPHSGNRLFFASASADTLTRPDATDSLLLGGDNGLRGYPLRYQSGVHRMLFTVEERFYTDLFVWRLFRVGGAVFGDLGQAWGGEPVAPRNPGWLADAGLGLRIVSARSAFSNVLHLDLAFPLNATADVRRVQFGVKTKTSF